MKRAEHVTFASGGLNRAAHLRDDRAELASYSGKSETIVLWQGKLLLHDQGGLARLPLDHPAIMRDASSPVFLGLDGERAVWVHSLDGWAAPGVDADQPPPFLDTERQAHPDISGASFVDLRAVMISLSRTEAELAATARSIIGWHASHGFCAKCGAQSQMTQAGWQRDCSACGTRHFPRTDPVVIMLITHGEKVLVGRSPGWPEGMYSLLAGFIEPGETIEAAVRREVLEEAGIEVGDVGYLSSQPWPFPSSLMIGCWGTALTRDIKIDPVEIEDARWLSREEVAEIQQGERADIRAARPGAIAHFLIQHWLADQLD